jgi:hypothetical protein
MGTSSGKPLRAGAHPRSGVTASESNELPWWLAPWSQGGGERWPNLERNQVMVALTGEEEGDSILVKIPRGAAAPAARERTNGVGGQRGRQRCPRSG